MQAKTFQIDECFGWVCQGNKSFGSDVSHSFSPIVIYPSLMDNVSRQNRIKQVSIL